MVQYLELASAVPATEQSNQKPSALAHRACHHRALHIGVAGDNLLVAIILLPRDVAIMVIADQHPPLLPWAHDTVRDDFASAVEPGARAGAAKNVGAGIDRIGQQPMNGIVARRAPLHGPPLATMDGNRQVNPLLPQPQGELAHAANLAELAEHQRQRLTDPPVRILFQAIISAAPVADCNRHVQIAARCFQTQRLS